MTTVVVDKDDEDGDDDVGACENRGKQINLHSHIACKEVGWISKLTSRLNIHPLALVKPEIKAALYQVARFHIQELYTD